MTSKWVGELLFLHTYLFVGYFYFLHGSYEKAKFIHIILNPFNVREQEHLAVPSIIGMENTTIFNYFKDRIWKKYSTLV